MDASESIFVDGKNEVVLAPTCPRCENEPKYLVTRRKTGERYWYSLGPDCEKARQQAKREAKAKPEAIVEVSPIGEELEESDAEEAVELPPNTLVLANAIQVELWDEEICGQLSDGMWENTNPHDHWKAWCDATAVIGDEIGRNFSVRKDGYRLTGLIEYVGDRMVAIGQKHDEDYDEKRLRKDLAAIKKAMKNYLA